MVTRDDTMPCKVLNIGECVRTSLAYCYLNARDHESPARQPWLRSRAVDVLPGSPFQKKRIVR